VRESLFSEFGAMGDVVGTVEIDIPVNVSVVYGYNHMSERPDMTTPAASVKRVKRT